MSYLRNSFLGNPDCLIMLQSRSYPILALQLG